MTSLKDSWPEPLQPFDRLTSALSPALAPLDALLTEYRQRRDAGSILPNLLESLRIELTYNSNAIEGNTLSLRETQLVVEGQSPPGARSMRELYEARNHDRALRMVEQWAAARPSTLPIGEQDLLDVHGQVLTDIDTASAGRFRSGRVLIAGTGFIPPGSHKFAALIPAMLGLVNRNDLHPIIQAAEFHYNLVAIHPFTDGNGRTARLLMNYCFLRHGYPCAIIEVTRRAEYLVSLDEANAGRTEPFARFIADSMERTLRKIIETT